MKKIVELIDVTKDFVQGDEVIHALRPTNFSANAGELIAIIGPSGSGKSTLLTILGGLQSPSSGRAFIAGKEFTSSNEKQRSKLRLQHVGFILQSSNLVPFLTIKEQLDFYDKVSGIKMNSKKQAELFKELNIEKLINKYPADLSGGEQQRAAIARALYTNPDVILADEPTASLDTKRAFDVVRLLSKETKERQKATIMVTHDERLIDFCDKVYVMQDGVLTQKK